MSSLLTDDTIAAIASPPGPALRGIVRLSGPDAMRIGCARFAALDGQQPTVESKPRLVAGTLEVGGFRSPVPAALALWPAPRTYTRQPIAEILTVGSPAILSAVLADCLERGARLAEPGEFTLRAFLSGRIDLTQAEAVLSVIDATSQAQLDDALHQLAGGLGTPVARLRAELLELLAHLEANLDFAEEPDVDELTAARLSARIKNRADEIGRLLAKMSVRDRPGTSPRVVLVGPANVGKSRLFNALTGGAHALVSDELGTTRDFLSAACSCGELTVDLIDTAGYAPPGDSIARLAESARHDQMRQADLLLVCQSSDTPRIDRSRLASDGIPQLLVWTKCDLAPPGDGLALATSAATGRGLHELRTVIERTIVSRPNEATSTMTTTSRCLDSLRGARHALTRASQVLAQRGNDELVAFELREALDELGRVVGSVVSDDILDVIFQRFCIGK